MVESNNGEERLARIEHTLAQLRKESAAFQRTTIELFDAVTRAARSKGNGPTPGAEPTPEVVVLHRKTAARDLRRIL
jgi:hypothetical protein